MRFRRDSRTGNHKDGVLATEIPRKEHRAATRLPDLDATYWREGGGSYAKEHVIMKALVSAAAGAALIATMSLAIAQEADPSYPAETPDAAAPVVPLTPDAMAPAPLPETTMAEGSRFIEQQGDLQMLASSWFGATVYNSADESIGDINDVLFAEDHSIAGIVLGVGGFLGIGEKSVAISIDAVEVSTDADGFVKFVLDATAEELESAPAFVSLADLRRQQLDAQPLPDAAPLGIAPEAPAQ